MKGRTTLAIAHPLSTIKEADEIIERGNHNELIEIEEGVYRKLTRMQQIG
jgi:ABC-type transport system involved in Fe-S cluster assembly fused permease/ATPase subunit